MTYKFSIIFFTLFLSKISSMENEKSGEKIINGQLVTSRQAFPYHVALLLKKNDVKDFLLCGGSIITPLKILTAAHCTFDTEYAIIIIGTHDLLINDTNVHKIKVHKSNFKEHPDFNFHYAHMDVSLINLIKPLEFNNFTQPIELPSKNLFEESFAGEIATTTGHGLFCVKNCGSSSTLRFSKNRVMSNEECQELSPFGTFPTETQICISTSEKDAGSSCKGDSGSGLTIKRNERNILIGISSFGSSNCEEGKPAVFTRLTKEIVEWIENN